MIKECKTCGGWEGDPDAFGLMVPLCRCDKNEGPGSVFTILIFLLAMLAHCGTCSAQTMPPPTRMELNGVPGMWFSEPDATRILSVWREANTLRLRIPVLEAMVENRNARIQLAERSLDLADRSIRALTNSNEALSSISAPRWYASPWLWLAIGLILGGTSVAIGITQ